MVRDREGRLVSSIVGLAIQANKTLLAVHAFSSVPGALDSALVFAQNWAKERSLSKIHIEVPVDGRDAAFERLYAKYGFSRTVSVMEMRINDATE